MRGKSLFGQLLGSRLLRHSGILFIGNGGAALLGLATLALTARLLGSREFGVLVLIQALVTVVDLVANFQVWQVLIRYGAGMLEVSRKAQFRNLVRLCLTLDAMAAIVGCAVAVAGGYLMAQMNHWGQQTAWLAACYGLVVLFNFSGTSIGILRLYDRYGLYTAALLIASTVRLGGVGLAWATDQGLPACLLAWMGGTLLQYLSIAVFALRELLRHDRFAVSGTARLGLTDSPDALDFLVSTKLQSAVRIGSRELDTLLVGSLLGASAAGSYKMVKQFAAVLGQLTDPFYQVLYPELVRLWGRGHVPAFMRLVRRSVFLAGAGGAAVWGSFVILGHWLLVATVGPEFNSAYNLLVWYMSGTALAVATFALYPATLAMGVHAAALRVLVLATILYLGCLVIFLPRVGLVAAGMAYLGFYAVWTAGMITIVVRVAQRGLTVRLTNANVKNPEEGAASDNLPKGDQP